MTTIGAQANELHTQFRTCRKRYDNALQRGVHAIA
jgi:hypothetical protein